MNLSSIYSFAGDFILTKEVDDRYQIGLTLNMPTGTNIINITNGTVVGMSNDPSNPTNLGKYIEVRHELHYFWDGQERSAEYGFIYSNLMNVDESLSIGDQISGGIVIGQAGEMSSPFARNNDIMLSMYSFEESLFLKFYTGSECSYEAGRYWYSAHRFIDGSFPPNNPFFHEEIDFYSHQFTENSISRRYRGYISLDEFPPVPDADFPMLYLSAFGNGLLPNNFADAEYQYTITIINNKSEKLVVVFPRVLKELYEANGYLGQEVYVLGTLGAVTDEGAMMFISDSSRSRPEDNVR